MSGLVIFAIVAGVILIAAAIFFLRPRAEARPEPESTMGSAWGQYVAGLQNCSPRDRRAIESLTRDGSGAAAAVQATLAETWREAQPAPDPRVALRQAIMDATDRFLMDETMRGDEGSGDGDGELSEYLASVAEAGALRCFSKQRFDDVGPDDWYTYYLKMAEMNAKNVAGMVRKTVRGEQASMEISLHDPLTSAMRDVRKALLQHPPRTPVRADKLVNREVPTRPYPSQEQLDRLIGVMSERLQKLFSGLVYQTGGGPPVEPAGAFQIDAGLLYAILAVNFRHPTDGWREIMDKSLGDYRSAMSNEEELLEIGRECHRIWQANQESGPLDAVLKTSCGLVFDDTGAADARASGMSNDARVLVGAILDVVAPSASTWKS